MIDYSILYNKQKIYKIKSNNQKINKRIKYKIYKNIKKNIYKK